MSDKNLFPGEGFSTQEFSPEERARFRHLYFVLNQDYRALDDNALDTIKDGIVIIKAIKILSSIIKVGGPVLIVMIGLGAWLRSIGIV